MNCQFCNNKIFETDRYCPSCNAPNIEQEEIRKEDLLNKRLQTEIISRCGNYASGSMIASEKYTYDGVYWKNYNKGK